MESNQMCFNKPSHDSDVHKSLRVISVREKMLSFLALPRASSAQRMLLELILRHCDSSRINSHSFKWMLHSLCSVSPSNHQDSWWIFNNFVLTEFEIINYLIMVSSCVEWDVMLWLSQPLEDAAGISPELKQA